MTTTENFKCYKNSTLSDAQNAGTSRFQIFLVGGGGGGGGHAPKFQVSQFPRPP